MTVSDRKPIRILMLLNRVPYPLNDGGAIAIYSAVKGYYENNCSLHFLVMNTTKHQVEEKQAIELFSGMGKIELVAVDNRITFTGALFSLFSSQTYIIRRFISRNYADRLVDILKNNEFDFIHVDTLSCTPYFEIIRSYSSAKIVYRAHNVEHLLWERAAIGERNILKRWYLRIQASGLKKFELDRCGKTDLVLSISKNDQERFAEISTRVLLVPAGVEMDENCPVQSSNSDIFFIGSFDWLPNLQGMEWFFENVWGALAKKFPTIRFTIAGKKMPNAIFNRKSQNVIPIGEVPDSRAFMLEHGIMLVPLISGSGIRIKILEAMALGKTVISTDVGAEGLGTTDGENILIANNADEFVSQIGRCIGDLEFRRKIGENAHRFALENFQNRRIFERLTAYYRQITE